MTDEFIIFVVFCLAALALIVEWERITSFIFRSALWLVFIGAALGAIASILTFFASVIHFQIVAAIGYMFLAYFLAFIAMLALTLTEK